MEECGLEAGERPKRARPKVGDALNTTMAGAAALPNLLQVLHNAGYDEGDLAKIAHENWQRVFRDTWRA